MSENRELDGQLWFFEHTLRKLLARTAIRRQEQWHIIFVPLTTETGLDQVHFTWGGVYPLEAFSHEIQGQELCAMGLRCGTYGTL